MTNFGIIDECCFSIPIKYGCILTGVFELMCFAIEAIFYDTIDHEFKGTEEWIAIYRIITVGICSSLIALGSAKILNRTAVLLHSLLLTLLVIVQITFEVKYFKFKVLHDLKESVAWGYTVYYGFLLHSLLIGYLYYWKLLNPNTSGIRHRRASQLRSRQMSSLISSDFYGI